MDSPSGTALNWLPTHQEHVLYTTAHVDSTVDSLAGSLTSYNLGGPAQLNRRYTHDEEQLVLVGIAPLPQAIPRLFADALNQARNSLEHVLYAEVTHRLRRPLTAQESKALEMPACDTLEKFQQWTKHKHRVSIGLFNASDDLYKRLERLQPFNRNLPDEHPLRVLAEHTNFAKHRKPSVAMTRIARVERDSTLPRKPAGHRDVAKIGDVLGSVPLGTREGFSIWPEVAAQRPHTGEWRTLMHELQELTDWVRRIAIPILITGTTERPIIPPDLDTKVGYTNADAAWRAAKPASAAERMKAQVLAAELRPGMLSLLVAQFGPQTELGFTAWIEHLDDQAVVTKFQPALEAATRGDTPAFLRAARAWAQEAGVQRRLAQ